MAISLVTKEKIAETSSKGNQEKWYDNSTDTWFKLDQYGYESLTEVFTTFLLSKSNVEIDTPFTFVRYCMEKLNVHGRERNGCASKNFLKDGQEIITINHLLSNYLGAPLKDVLMRISSDIKRIAFLAESTVNFTGLSEFPKYLTLLFEIDALILNDDRHLNNIAVITDGKKYDYCPIFDNGAGLLSNTQLLQMDIMPYALIKSLLARPFNTSFNRQQIATRNLYGSQLIIPKLSRD